MSEKQKSFIELSLQGKALLDEIDDYIDAWHDDPDGQPLHKYLGMKKSEYALWVRDPDTLALIVKARHDDRPLAAVVNDNYRLRVAARSGDPTKIRRLERWLKDQGKLD